MRRLLGLLIPFALLFASDQAFAHTGTGYAFGMSQGLAHPLGGLDHILAMMAVGLLAVCLGGRALILLPASFLSAMLAGGMLGIAGADLPLTEFFIALSVIVFGAALAFGFRIHTAAAMMLVSLFAVFHGYAHGTEIPGMAPALANGLGFVTATALLHVTGIGLGLLINRVPSASALGATKIAGGAIAITGAAILGGIL